MNCLEFRHHLLTNPLQEPVGFAQHRMSCPACAREAQQARQFEQQLRTAAMIEIPEGLQARILLAQALDKPPRAGRRPWLSLAASLLLTIGIVGGLAYRGTTDDSDALQTAVFEHINAELQHLHENRDLQPEQLSDLFKPYGAQVQAGIGKVKYAGRCTIRRHAGIHLVIPGQRGPVTVLFMPGEYLKTRQDIHTTRFSALIVPTGYGSMAVVGDPGEALDEALNKVSQNVAWGI